MTYRAKGASSNVWRGGAEVADTTRPQQFDIRGRCCVGDNDFAVQPVGQMFFDIEKIIRDHAGPLIPRSKLGRNLVLGLAGRIKPLKRQAPMIGKRMLARRCSAGRL